ncbi:MAG: DUF3786 domain-containing protein [Desulfobacter sp.]|nr:MAG: DUF3786 domain-containing protein [Desulfobacter sp.]
MPEFKNAMEVFSLLDKSNCRKCDEPTCLAFASKVFLGQKNLDRCPALAREVIARYQGHSHEGPPGEREREEAMAAFRARLAGCDLEAAAQRTGGKFKGGWLTLRIFGKLFSINNAGRFRTDLHVNPWMVMPVMNYVLDARGAKPSGDWVPFRELAGGMEKNNLFARRGEGPLKNIADTYPALFEDLVDMFSGEPMDRAYESDISLVLYPLPLLPMLVCYWKPEEGMASNLTLFFDRSADQNGGSAMIFNLATGMVRMFEKFAATHGVKEG